MSKVTYEHNANKCFARPCAQHHDRIVVFSKLTEFCLVYAWLETLVHLTIFVNFNQCLQKDIIYI